MFSGWEILNNDFSLVEQLQCGLNHITGSQKPFWSVNSTNSKVSVEGSVLHGGDGRGSRGLGAEPLVGRGGKPKQNAQMTALSLLFPHYKRGNFPKIL